MAFDGEHHLTWRALGLGIFLSLLVLLANMYLALRSGTTISANLTCTVAALVALRGFRRATSKPEVNLAQAMGAVGDGIAAGVVFFVPALVFSRAYTSFENWTWREYGSVAAATLAGSLLGVGVAWFFRGRLILPRRTTAPWPEAVSSKELLDDGMEAGGRSGRWGVGGVASTLLAGACVTLASRSLRLIDETVCLWRGYKVADVSPALIGVGLLVGFKCAAAIAAGSALALALPSFFDGSVKLTIKDVAAGAMIVGGLWSFVDVKRERGTSEPQGEPRPPDPPRAFARLESGDRWWLPWCLALVGLSLAAAVYWMPATGSGAALLATLLTPVGVLFVAFLAIYSVGIVGTTNAPVSGIMIFFVLLVAFVLVWPATAHSPQETKRTILLVGCVVGVAGCVAAITAQNLKIAHLLNTTARPLVAALLVAGVVTSLASLLVLGVFDRIHGIRPDPDAPASAGSPTSTANSVPPEAFLAPQATVIALLVDSIVGSQPAEPSRSPGEPLPAASASGNANEPDAIRSTRVLFGAALAILVIALSESLRRFNTALELSPLVVAVGIYLPMAVVLPMLLGGVVRLVLERQIADKERLSLVARRGELLAAGLVAGEGLGVLVVACGFSLALPLFEPGTARTAASLLVLLGLPVALGRSLLARAASAPTATRLDA